MVRHALFKQVFINLIRHHQKSGMAPHQLSQLLQLLTAQHTTCGIAGRVDHQQASGGSDCSFEGLQVKTKTIGCRGWDSNGPGASEPCHLGVAEPVGRGNQNLISRVQQHLKQVVDGLLSSIGDKHLLRRGGEAVFSSDLAGDGQLQFRVS